MALNLSASEPLIREIRLGSITGYQGSLGDLVDRTSSGRLEGCGRCFSTSCSCSHHMAVCQLADIEDAVVVDHAPLGCSAGQILLYNLKVGRNPGRRVRYIVVSTNIRDADAIFGATDKLRETIRAAYRRHKPKVIYVSSSCASAIIGDDMAGVAAEMSEELGIPVGYAGAEGFKSKVWASGFDVYGHAVSATLLEPSPERRNAINYIAFSQVGKEDIASFFDRLGLEVVYLTDGSRLEDFRLASRSIATFGQCSALASYLAGALEQLYGIKYIQSHQPNGGVGFERFYRELAALVDKEDAAEQVIAEERAKYADELEGLRSRLKGKRALVALGGGFAHEYARILGELGVEVVHTVAYHYDPRLDNQSQDAISTEADVRELGLDGAASVNDGQQFETYLLCKKTRPDFVISRLHGASEWALRLGINALEAEISLQLFGYAGLVRLGRRLAAEAANSAFARQLGARYVSPFSAAFEAREPFSFMEG
jgi:nitrogenase molybdenum-iron protein alpha chain